MNKNIDSRVPLTKEAVYGNDNNTEVAFSDPYITKNPAIGEMITEPTIGGDDPSIGPRDAKINLVLFSDFDCAFCKKQYDNIKQVMKKYQDSVRLVWKDYPDADENSRSWLSGVAGRCAYDQGRFWEYHDLLFSDDDSSLESLADQAGLNVKEFKKCIKGDQASSKIKESIHEADALKIAGVPFVYINKKEILGEISPEELERMIEFELQGGVK